MSEKNSVFEKILTELLSLLKVSACILGRDGALRYSYHASSGENEETAAGYPQEALVHAISSFIDYDVSDVLDLPESGGTRCRGIAARDQSGRVDSVLLIFADGMEDEAFDRITRVLSDALREYSRIAGELVDAASEIERERGEIGELKRFKNLYQSMLGLIDDVSLTVDFEDTAFDVMKRTAQCVDFDLALVIKVSDQRIRLVKEYKPSEHWLYKSFDDVSKDELPFLDQKTYTISSDSVISKDFKNFFEKYGIKAGIFIPVSAAHPEMYLLFLSTSREKNWSNDEMGFARKAGALLRAKRGYTEHENAIGEASDFIRTVFNNSSAAVAVYDALTKEVLYQNDRAKELFKDPLNEELFGRQFLIPGPSDDTDQVSGEFSVPDTGDTYEVNMIWARTRGKRVYVVTITDISKQKQYQRKLMEAADIDDLTGLYNRHRFHLDFETCISDAKRGGSPGTLILIDLDDFNALNGGLGHILADKFLKKAAWSIQQLVKKDAQCYRIGGDQFAVLIPYSSYEGAKNMANLIQTRFRKPFSLDGNDYYCTAGMGIVNFPQDGDKEDDLLSRADFALHQAKSKGKNQINIFTDIEISMPPDRLNIEKAMREAVADDCREFVVYYQPVVDISHGETKCCGAEALVRWNSHKLGFMSPDKFISLAEYLGLIVPIGEHVLLSACRRCRHWNEFGHPDYRVNVNISVLQLLQNDIVQVIDNAVKVSGINPDNLVLEVTEGMAINDMQKMKDVLGRIHDLGVRIALDDFGTGYSSLSHMKELPLDELKIDKCFIDDIDKDGYSDAFVRSVSQLADAVNLNVVVEGVERHRQQDVLKDMDVDMIQGYLYDKPLPDYEFESKWL